LVKVKKKKTACKLNIAEAMSKLGKKK